VYDHFPTLASLYDVFFTDRTERYLAGIDAALARGASDRATAFAGVFQQLLAIPPEDRRAIRLVMTDLGRPELDDVRARFRAHIERRWLLAVRNREDRRVARARLWMLVSGLFALADLVDRAELSAATATGLATEVARTIARPEEDG
jgi:hypothetical protein